MIRFLLFCFSEGLTNLWRSRVLNFLSIGTMMLAVFILGSFLMLGVNLRIAVASWEEDVQFHVFLLDEISEEETREIQETLESDNNVSDVRFISKSEARQRFQSQFSAFSDLDDALEANPFPASLFVTLTTGAREKAVKQINAKLAQFQGLDEVHYDFDVFEKLHFLSKLIHWVSMVLVGIVIFASVFTISNVLKLTFLTRRDEVDIMKLVGASRAYIRGPFMVEGMLQGMVGTLLGLIVLYGCRWLLILYLSKDPEGMLAMWDVMFLPLPWMGSLVGGGCLVGFFGATMSLNQFLAEHISYQ